MEKTTSGTPMLSPLLETLGLIYMTQNFETAKEDMLNALADMTIDSRQFYKQHLSYLDKYVQDFASVCHLDIGEEAYFVYNTEFFLTITGIATELFDPDPSAPHLEKQQILSVMSEFLSDEDRQEKKTLCTLEDIFASLSGAEYSDDTKWRLLELFHAPVEKFQQLFQIYRRNLEAFYYAYGKNKSHLDKLLSAAPAKPSKAVQNITTEFYPLANQTCFTAILPLMEWITPSTVFRGVLADKIDLYREEMNNARERLPQILKLLGDKSKFEILCLLKTHGKYNLEIAEELQLTPATTSHHMSMLLSNQMVSVEKKDGKVYYRLDQKTLKEIIHYLEKLFL